MPSAYQQAISTMTASFGAIAGPLAVPESDAVFGVAKEEALGEFYELRRRLKASTAPPPISRNAKVPGSGTSSIVKACCWPVARLRPFTRQLSAPALSMLATVWPPGKSVVPVLATAARTALGEPIR